VSKLIGFEIDMLVGITPSVLLHFLHPIQKVF